MKLNSTAARRRERIRFLADLLGVDYLILEHHSGWSAQIHGITVTRGNKSSGVRRRFPTRTRAEKVLLEELDGMAQLHALSVPKWWRR